MPFLSISCRQVRRNVIDFATDRQFWLAVFYDLVLGVCVLLSYYTASYFGTLRYLKWAEQLDKKITPRENPLKDPLPDVVLDNLGQAWNKENWITVVVNALSALPGLLAFAFCLVYRYADIINHGMCILIILVVGKGITENVTIIPSAYGYSRCRKVLGMGNGTSADFKFSFGPTGSCSDMMWSGHTQHAMLGVYLLLSAFERRWPVTFGKLMRRNVACVSTKTVIVSAAGILEGTLLVCDFMHYTSDVFVAFFVTSLCLSHERLKRGSVRMNPFLRPIADDMAIPMLDINVDTEDTEDTEDTRNCETLAPV